ncbi:ABC transporter permease [Candidatus Chloroploca sp. Khr17]|uniref:ABC transporter permease n=1 Tax=Candidatus Chloroploca sp. Khr17 TaxID=2496869 RepID=UPI00101C07CC|nr:ABC transporter permease subunit [Candidatus Chloroploca sp. Khr17]
MQATTVSTPAVRSIDQAAQWFHMLWPPVLMFVLGIALWESAVWLFEIPIYLLPAPSQIMATFLERPWFLLGIGMVTFSNALMGSAIGCSLGVLVAIFCVRWTFVADGLVPLAIAASAVPIIALSPLMGIWLGSVSAASKIGVIAVMTFFPTLVSVYAGLISPRADALLLMRSYAAPQRAVFLKLRMPAALPFLFNALRVCATLSMIGAVVAEFFGGPRNALGVYIKTQAGILRTREAWSAIMVACLYGLIFYLVIVLIERWVMPWKHRHSGQ